VVIGQPQLIKFPTKEVKEISSGKTYWQQKVKEVAYIHLNVSICNFRLHIKAQWDAIHGDLAKIYIIDPPLRPLTMER
jgi:hypothetical protein